MPSALPEKQTAGGRAALLLAALVALFAATPVAAQGRRPAAAGDILQQAPAGLLPARLPVAGGDGWRVGGIARAFDAADAVAVQDFEGAWNRYAPRPGRNAAIQVLQAELLASRGVWETALVARHEFVIKGSRGAWDAVRADRRKEALLPGTQLDIDAIGKGVGWGGIRTARTWRLEAAEGTGTWRLTLGATLLSVRRLQGFEAVGQVGFDGTAYSFEATGWRQDSWREFAGFGTSRATGTGASADLGLAWQGASGRTFANLSLVDALSTVRIDGVATHRFAATSSTTSTDAEGFIVYQPLLTGRYAGQQVRTHLPRKTALLAGTLLDMPWGTMPAGLRVEHVAGLTLPAAWTALPLPGGVFLQLDAEARFRSLGAGLVGPRYSVFVRTRSLPVGGSRTLGWQVALTWPL